MGRLFNNAAGERIEFTGAPNLAGFTWPFGTVAFILKWANTTGTQAINTFLYSGGVNFNLYYDGGNLTYWRSGAGSDFSFTPNTANHYMVVMSKGTGTVAPFFAVLNMTAGTWSSGNGSGSLADQGTMTNVIIGAEDTAGANRYRGEMWEVAYWRNYAMTLNEMRRMAGGNFGRFNPTSWWAWPEGRDNNVVARSHGQCRMLPSTQVGATRGTSKRPPGWLMPVAARRR